MLNRYLVLFLLLTGGASAAQAQQETLASATFKQRLRGQYLHNDTAQAIITLYSKRQAGGASWIVGGALAALRIATANSTRATPPPGYTYASNDNSNLGVVATLVALPIIAYGIGKIAVYSNGHLESVLTDYAASQRLPRSLRRRLAPRFFAQPIIQYRPVLVHPVE